MAMLVGPQAQVPSTPPRSNNLVNVPLSLTMAGPGWGLHSGPGAGARWACR